jgi:hypothetical protein
MWSPWLDRHGCGFESLKPFLAFEPNLVKDLMFNLNPKWKHSTHNLKLYELVSYILIRSTLLEKNGVN